MAINKPIVGVAIAVVAIGVGSWFYLRSKSGPPLKPPVAAQLEAPAPAEPVIDHPVPPAPADAGGGAPAALPALGESDGAVNTALTNAVDSATLAQFLRPDNIIRHLVVTIDNLPRQKVALEKRPIGAMPGIFLVNGDELQATLDEQNFARYRPLTTALRKVDMQRVAAVYLRFYPLFQQAYEDLGYPKAYFNDRLVKVIDVLLATPQPTGPLQLVRPNVMYVFADPSLESRPEGQKILLRMGPDNAAVVKAKLMELRAAVTAAPPRR